MSGFVFSRHIHLMKKKYHLIFFSAVIFCLSQLFCDFQTNNHDHCLYTVFCNAVGIWLILRLHNGQWDVVDSEVAKHVSDNTLG